MHEIVIEEKLRDFVKDYCDGRCSMQLLLFLGKHPHARFSQLAMVHALDARKTEIEKALTYLSDKRLVVTWNAENGLPFYSLTEQEPLCGLVSGLVALDWWQWQLMLGQF